MNLALFQVFVEPFSNTHSFPLIQRHLNMSALGLDVQPCGFFLYSFDSSRTRSNLVAFTGHFQQGTGLVYGQAPML